MRFLVMVLLVLFAATEGARAQLLPAPPPGHPANRHGDLDTRSYDPRFNPLPPGQSGPLDPSFHHWGRPGALPELNAPVSEAERRHARLCLESRRGITELAIPFYLNLVRLNATEWGVGVYQNQQIRSWFADLRMHARAVAEEYVRQGRMVECAAHMRGLMAAVHAEWLAMLGGRAPSQLPSPDQVLFACRWPETLAGVGPSRDIVRYRTQNRSCAEIEGIGSH